MEMFLMALALSLLGVSVSAIAFTAAMPDDSAGAAADAPPLGEPLPADRAGFFLEQRWPALDRQVPIEVLLLQIERHVRLEHAAAEAFQQAPTPELLHTRTASPLVH